MVIDKVYVVMSRYRNSNTMYIDDLYSTLELANERINEIQCNSRGDVLAEVFCKEIKNEYKR